MRVKREKGFKKIKIVDSNYDYQKHSYFENINISNIIYIIIIIVFLCLYIFLKFFPFSTKNDSTSQDIIFSNEIYSNNKTIELEIKNNNSTKKTNLIQTDKKIDDIKVNMNNISKIRIETTTYDTTNITYDIFAREFMENPNPKISLIIIDFMDECYEKLFGSIQKQSFFDIEIIIADDDITNYKNNSEIYEKLTKNDKRIKIIKYKNHVGKLKKRIDSVEASRAQYIVFIDGDDFFNSNQVLTVIYDKMESDNVDILEFKSFHYLNFQNSFIYRQPELFDIMYFGEDAFYSPKQFHVTGKIIKKKLFLNITKDFDDFYLNQVINNYEESMFLLLLFKKAESFELLRIQGTGKSCRNCLYIVSNIYNNEEAKKDLLLYSKMLIQYGNNNVPERRGAANFFINYVLNRRISFANKKYTQFLEEVFELYLACDKISKPDQITIKNFQNQNENK